MSVRDTIIVPRLSSWFGFFRENSTEEVEPLFDSRLYSEDWLGLRALHSSGRLHFAECDCMHVQGTHAEALTPD